MIALDASALLAFLFREEGHERVAPHIDQCCISVLNLSEVIGRFVRDGHDGRLVLDEISATPIELVPFGGSDALLTARLLPRTRPLGLSLADRVCLALAQCRAIPVLTADRAWAALDVGVEIQLIR